MRSGKVQMLQVEWGVWIACGEARGRGIEDEGGEEVERWRESWRIMFEGSCFDGREVEAGCSAESEDGGRRRSRVKVPSDESLVTPFGLKVDCPRSEEFACREVQRSIKSGRVRFGQCE